MLFNSEIFVCFALVFFALYFFLSHRGQLLWIVASSYLFYGWWDYRFLALLIGSTAVNFWLGQTISKSTDSKKWMIVGVTLNLIILGLFKYFGFFVDSLEKLISASGATIHMSIWKITLPIGISFYTFHSINYLVDVWRRKIPAEGSLLKYATYIALWPQLVAGPIVRASRLLPQLQAKKVFRWANFQKGCEYIVIGLFLKSALADGVSPLVDRIFAAPAAFSGVNIALGVVLFAFQIYGDFAGYSMMAIGFGRIMGLNLGINFRRPYLSRSFSDFWTRWHISLSRWLRDYLYIPLGGNRRGRLYEHRNLNTTMLLGGLWHGASWTFVMWGGLHGALLSLQRVLGPRLKGLWTPLKIAGVFVGVCLTWVFFRAENFPKAWAILEGLTRSWNPGTIQNRLDIGVALVLVGSVWAVEALVEFVHLDRKLARRKHLRAVLTALLALTIAVLGRFEGASFIYFQF